MISCQLSTLLGAQRMSLRELAKRAGLRMSTIDRLYHDDWQLIDRLTLERLCQALQVPVGKLLVGPDKTPVRDQETLEGIPLNQAARQGISRPINLELPEVNRPLHESHGHIVRTLGRALHHAEASIPSSKSALKTSTS
jgi:putative transcriptional regulator